MNGPDGAARKVVHGDAFDVIVVGARAAGAATAMLLGRHGARVLLLERGALGADTLSTHALMRGGVLQLARWGLLDDIVAAGTPPVRSTTFRYGSEEIRVAIKPHRGVDALYAPRRTVLDPLLVRAAVDAGVAVHHRSTVQDLLWRHGGVVGVRARVGGGPSIEVFAPLVIGADGVRSTVARMTGARFTRVGTSAGAGSYGYFAGLETDGYEWTFRPDACSGFIPTNDGLTCVFASGSPHRIGRGGAAVIERVVAAAGSGSADRLRAATQASGIRSWSGRRGYMREAAGPGWALVGDAGYHKDPLSAHGITDALRDAELLARAVSIGLDAHGDLPGALREYEAVRDRLSLPLFDVVERIASQQWDDARIGSLLRELSSAMVDEVEALASLAPVATP